MRRNEGFVVGILLVAAVALAACGGGAAPAPTAGGRTPAAPTANAAAPAAGQDYASPALPTAYDNALPAGTQLALGIFRLEGTPLAVTQAQAKTLMPLWQAFEGNALQDQTEQNAVLKQIEGSLTADQVKAIAGMYLTAEDMRQWMTDHNMQAGAPPNGTPGPGGNLTDAQRQGFRATAQANGGQAPQGGQGGGNFGNLTDAQRQTFRATVEAGGGQFPQGGRLPNGTPGPGGRGARFFGGYRMFVAPLVQLLTQRAGG